MVSPSLPLMVPAAFMNAAWAAQPDFLITLIGEICRHLALVMGWVPHSLNELVIRMRKRFLALLIEAYACNTSMNLRG